MLPKRTALIASLAVALAAPAPASAHHPSRIRYSPISAAYTVAARYWREQPCAGRIVVAVEPVPTNDGPVPAGSQPSMWATWDTGTPNENDEAAPQPFASCRIGINPVVWTSERLMGETAWPEFAIDMIHEFHHLMGHGDLFGLADSGSIDYVEPSSDVAVTGLTAPGWGG